MDMMTLYYVCSCVLFIFTINMNGGAISNNIKAGLNLTGYMVEKPEPDGKEGSKYTLLLI